MTSEDWHGQSFSAELDENLREFLLEHGDLSPEELLQEQECVLQSLQIHGREWGGTPDHGQSSDLSPFSGQEGESSRSRSLESLLALDEALARSLEELGDDFDESEIFGHTSGSSREIPASPNETPVTAGSPDVRQDEVNPDDMSYEQLQSLGDSIGTEGKGLSEEFISDLPSFKYRTGYFSNNMNDECVICYMNCEEGENMTALPCLHQYHTECIKTWLKIDKICPVCKEEVREY